MVKKVKEGFHLNGDKDTASAVKKFSRWATLILLIFGVLNWVSSKMIYGNDILNTVAANKTATAANAEAISGVCAEVDDLPAIWRDDLKEHEKEFEGEFDDHVLRQQARDEDTARALGRIEGKLETLVERIGP